MRWLRLCTAVAMDCIVPGATPSGPSIRRRFPEFCCCLKLRSVDHLLPLDATNRAIVSALAADPQLSRAELARRINLSPPAVGERVARLEEAGVIKRRID